MHFFKKKTAIKLKNPPLQSTNKMMPSSPSELLRRNCFALCKKREKATRGTLYFCTLHGIKDPRHAERKQWHGFSFTKSLA